MKELTYTVLRSARRTLSLQVKQDGSVLVRCPRRYPQSEIQKFVESKSQWILKNLRQVETLNTLPHLTEEELEILNDQAHSIIPQRVRFWAPKVGVSYGRITIRRQKTRWGSCSSQGNLNFNLLLMLAPPEVLDYIVVHELCHRKQMNHSRAFWAEVEAVLPDYRQQELWLKRQGGSILARGTRYEGTHLLSGGLQYLRL